MLEFKIPDDINNKIVELQTELATKNTLDQYNNILIIIDDLKNRIEILKEQL